MKIQNAKTRQNSPSGHHCTTLSGCIFATEACINSQKKTCLTAVSPPDAPHNMANFGPLTAEIDLPVWGTKANFNGFRASCFRYCSDVAHRRPTKLHDVWASPGLVHYIYIFGDSSPPPPDGILPGAKFTFGPSLALSYIGSITAPHSSSGRQQNFAAWYKDRNYGTFAEGSTYSAGRPSRWASAHILAGIIPHKTIKHAYDGRSY